MLQFLTANSEKYSAAEQAQMAIEGGCRWIQLSRRSINDSTSSAREMLDELKPLCEENEAFLMVDGDVNIANDYRIHGVHLAKGDMAPAAARELLGPHAVIGVDVESYDDIAALRRLDIDYVVLYPFGSRLTIDDYRGIISRMRLEGIDFPVVARGEIRLDDIAALRRAGVNGVALSDLIVDATDPVAETKEIISKLENP